MGRLDSRVCVITGGGRGIGAAIARTLAGQGAKIVVNDLGASLEGEGEDQAPASQVVEEIRSVGGQAISNFGDITDYDQAEALIQSALDEFGGLDVMINVAGILRDRMIFNMAEHEWDDVIRVHMKGTFNTTRFASIHWRSERKGHYRLINFTSVSGLYGAPGQPNYAAAKMGIVGFTLSCANALQRYGVTANAISPGAHTRMIDSIPGDRRRAGSTDQPPENPERSPNNIAIPVAYLASEASDWLSGRVIGSRGYEIELISNPQPEALIVGDEPWDIEAAAEEIERVFRPIVEYDGDAAAHQALAAGAGVEQRYPRPYAHPQDG